MNRPAALSCGVFFLCFLSSCGDDSPSTTCRSCAEELTAAASDSLENIFPGPEGFTAAERSSYFAAYDLYSRALEKDPENETAHFGYALTTVLLLESDPFAQEAFHVWRDFLAERTPLVIEARDDRPLGIWLSLHRGAATDTIPFELLPVVAAAPILALPDLETLPNLGLALSTLHENVLPALDDAIGHLDKVPLTSGFRFVVTGRMQGNRLAPSLEADRADLLLMWSGCHLMAAFARVATARETRFGVRDSTNLLAGLRTGGPWLRLRSDGHVQLTVAGGEAHRAAFAWRDALNALLQRADTRQEKNLIVVSPIEQPLVSGMASSIAGLVSRLDEGRYDVSGDWDRNPVTPDRTLSVDMTAAWSGIPSDFKTVLPDFSPAVHADPVDVHVTANDGFASYVVTVPRAGPYFGVYAFVHVDSLDYEEETMTGDEALRGSLSQFVRARFQAARSVADWSGFYTGSASVNATLEPGGDLTSVAWHETYGVAGRFELWPAFHWTAGSFAEWEIRSPAAGGLLPGITTTSDLLDLLGYDGSTWRRDAVLRWTEPHVYHIRSASLPVGKHP